MFGPMPVHLQRQRSAGFHHDALDLEAVAGVDGFVIAPGAVHATVGNVLGARLPVEPFDHLFHLLRTRFVGNEHGVVGFDDQEILRSEHRHETVFGAYITVVAVVQVDIPAHDVTGSILFARFPERHPRTDVAPSYVRLHHHGLGGTLHYGVIDGF